MNLRNTGRITRSVLFPEGSFSTDVYTEKMITFIKDGEKDKPFFAYLTYTAPHWPLQVPADYIDKYKGKYDIGYDSLRVIRFNQQKKMGIIPSNATLPPGHPGLNLGQNFQPKKKRLNQEKWSCMLPWLITSINILAS